MSIITYPLNGVKYAAADAETYLCTRKSGVYSASDHFAASVTGDRQVTIGPGLAWINNAKFTGKSILSNADVPIDVPLADGALPRVDRIVLRYDKAANASEIAIKQGTPSASPAAPSVQQDELVYELGLYTVSVGAASLTVSIADVTSTMLDESVCGLMTDGVTGLPTQHFENQWRALMDQLNELLGGTAGVISINGKNGAVTLTASDVGAYSGVQVLQATLTASGWGSSSSAAYQQTVSVTGAQDTDEYDADVDMSTATADSGEEILEAWGLVGRIVTGSGTVTAYAYGDKPEVSIPIRLRRVV